MPAVLLQNMQTGRRVWFFNTHNPADVRGPAQQWRDAGFAMEAALANELRATYPDAPFISFGDKNDRARYYCAVAPSADLWSASGGYTDGATCSPPGGGAIDWIMGSKNVFFNGYTRCWNDFVSTDQRPPALLRQRRRPGLRAAGHRPRRRRRGPRPDLDGRARVRVRRSRARRHGTADGASTTNARTATESTGPDANLISLITGRRVYPKAGGHGVGSKCDAAHDRAPVRRASTSPASSTWRTTTPLAPASSPAASRPSWSARAGTRSRAARTPTARTTAPPRSTSSRCCVTTPGRRGWWREKIARRASDLSVIELSGAAKAGEAERLHRRGYQKAVRKVFRRVAAIRRGIDARPR